MNMEARNILFELEYTQGLIDEKKLEIMLLERKVKKLNKKLETVVIEEKG
ncbi:hypothetical protein LCM23_06455 [Cytobacillus kochii]|nr:hypothetical protein [Cytobacillus kochii]MCA1025727.1 hypothetical protein [Cytobacillus kochii]